MKLAYRKLNTVKLFGVKIIENKTEYVEHSIENDRYYDNIFVEKFEKYIESKN